MKNIYIHIGYPKSASSMLQSYFFPFLKNINYVKEPELYDALLLRKFPNGEKQREIKLYDFNKRLSDNEIYLISNEHFSMPSSWLNPDVKKFNSRNQISRLIKKYFPDAKILLIIRRQLDWIESWYQERVKRNEKRNIEDLVSSSFFKKEIIKYLDYNLTTNHYYKLFGKENIKIIPMEIIKDNPQEFSNEITDFLRIKKVKKIFFPVVKNSQSYFLTELKRKINNIIHYLNLKKESTFTKLLLIIYKKFSSLFAITLKLSKPKRLKFGEQQLASNFEKSNIIFQKKINKNLKKYDYF